MRLLLLSRNAALYSTSRLVLAGRARGHRVDVVDPLALQVAVAPRTPRLLYAGHRLPRYRAVIPRIGSSITGYGLAVLEQLEASTDAVLNDAKAIGLARDKVLSLGRLARGRIRVPATVYVHSTTGLDEAVQLLGGCPAIVKLQRGTQGVGTMMAHSKSSLRALVETFVAMGQQVLVQQLVRSPKGCDIRVLVVGGRVLAAMRRRGPAGEFRSNLHRGAHAEPWELPRRHRHAALRAASILGLDVAGVDILDCDGTPWVLEVNSSPGLEGIETTCKIDVAGAIIRHAERRVATTHQKRGARSARARRASEP